MIEAFTAKDSGDLAGAGVLRGSGRILARLPLSTWALVTTTKANIGRARLAAADPEVPSYLVIPDDVPADKPDPLPYLRGAELLGLPPAAFLAIKDAPPDLISAPRAGCRTLGLLSTRTQAEIPAADYLAADPAHVTLRHLPG